MRPDQLSRSLRGERSFSTIEIAMLADELGRDVHWLITGTPDPMRRELAARHEFEPATGRYDTPGWERDQAELDNIELAYRQVYQPDGKPAPLSVVPSDPAELRATLGADFVRPFIDVVESKFPIDVVRLPNLSHSYTMRLGSHIVIVIPASGSWFYENYSIGHELGHLASNSLSFDAGTDTNHRVNERQANVYAAQLLLPADVVQAEDWTSITFDGFAKFLWKHGVSTKVLGYRIAEYVASDKVSPSVQRWLRMSTVDVMKRCGADLDGEGRPAVHDVAERQVAAAQRRFPTSLVEAHIDRALSGEGSQDTLAWLLGVQRVFVDDTSTSGFDTNDGKPFADHSTADIDDLSKLLEI